MGEQSGEYMGAVLPNCLSHYDGRIGMNVLEDLHPHALRVNEAVLQNWIDRVSAAQLDPLFEKSGRQLLFQAGLRGPANLIGGLA
jgi:hypothetical protein